VDLAVALGVTPERIDTVIDFACAQRHGGHTDAACCDRERSAAERRRRAGDARPGDAR
jgi:hypothetical protein